MRYLITIILLFTGLLNNRGMGEPKFTIASVPWKESLGNHRAVIDVPESAGCVFLHLDWRRHDKDPGLHRFIIINANSGDTVRNIHRYNVNNEFCEIAFGPVSAGTWNFYYLPLDVKAGWSGYGDEMIKPEPSPSDEWMEANNVTAADRKMMVQAFCKEIQARSVFDSFYPMEVIATEQEKAKLSAAAESFILFPEDRSFPIRMLDNIPSKWIGHPSHDSFTGLACRNEYYVFQVGLWALTDITDVTTQFSGLESVSGSIPASAITCFNTSGTDPYGNHFTRKINVSAKRVQPLWIGIDIPETAAPGEYRGYVTIGTENAGDRKVQVTLVIKDEIIADRGDGELWRHSRLRWLNSTAGIDDRNVAPYAPIKYLSENRLVVTGKEIRLGRDGLPESLKAYGEEILSSPVKFSIVKSNAPAGKSSYHTSVLKSAEGITSREVTYSDAGISFNTYSDIESDGYLKFRVSITPGKDMDVDDIRLTIPFRKEISEYMMGMGLPGSITPLQHDAKWSKPQDAFWIGNTLAGLHCELRGASYTGPLLNLYKPGYPDSWNNAGKGGFRIETTDNSCNVTVYSGPRTLKKDETVTYEWAFIVTPVKKINTHDHFSNRYYHNYPDPDPAPGDLKNGFYGIKVINLHHANRYNPFINYPFLAEEELKSFVDRFHSMDIKAKIYYTIREVSNNMVEIWAMRSLGDEIFRGKGTGGNPWLREHLVDGYSHSWYERIDSVRKDAAIVTAAGTSRWYNYYVEGLKWMISKYGIDGLYLDDVAFDRNMLKRMRKVMEAEKPGCLIDLHSNTAFSIGPAIQYTEFFPYIDKTWFGEGFHYNTLTPAQWMVEVSSLPFGLMNDMLGVAGNSPEKGMVYGMTTRYPWATVQVTVKPYDIWKVWDSFGIEDAQMVGYWDKDPVVGTSSSEVLATAYVKRGKMLISLASWSEKPVDALLEIDYRRAGLDPSSVRITAPAIPGFQEAAEFTPGIPVRVEPSKGCLLIVEGK